VQIESIEAAARQQEQVVTLERASRTQFARITITLPQQLALRETAAFAVLGKVNHHQRQACHQRRQFLDFVGRFELHGNACGRRRAGLHGGQRFGQRPDLGALTRFSRIAPGIGDDFTLISDA
jgi:hypothetical protein